jgi:small ligand-binding sensory domain FIST
MRFAAAASEHPLATHAVGEVVGAVLDQVGPSPDLAVVFVSVAHAGALDDIANAVRALLGPHTLVGVTASSLLAGDREIEGVPAVALWAGRIGPVDPVRLLARRSGDDWQVDGLPEFDDRPRTLVLMADPFTFPTDAFLDELGRRAPQVTVIGGLASAGRGAAGNRLVLDDAVLDDGAVGFLLDDRHHTRTVVSQGCRPVGDPFVVTRSERNALYELAGRPALERVRTMVDEASDVDRSLMARGLHVGIVIDEQRERFDRGDFLVRNVLGADRDSGAVMVGRDVAFGSTVQFQVRDATSADADLRAQLSGAPAAAALVFTCTGRGSHLFGEPDHDATLVHAATGGGATAGMFCAGEMGPVGARNFLHGFTASVLLFEP